MKKILLIIAMVICMFNFVNAISVSSGNLYVDVNTTYPLVLIPLDNNTWDIYLNVNISGNWTTLNFTWTGSQYELNILFADNGNFPFVINSTNVSGEITGKFLVRQPFNVTFQFYEDKKATIFNSNKYINNMAYVTAELTGDQSTLKNTYDSNLEPFIAYISDDRYLKPVFYGKYNNGIAQVKIYEQGEYAVRLKDGEMTFNGVYSVPNITKSYGTNVYVGKYTLTNSSNYSLLLTKKDLNPYGWLFNWGYIISLVICLVIGLFLFFIVPEFPLLSFGFGLIFPVILTLLRIVAWFWWGF